MVEGWYWMVWGIGIRLLGELGLCGWGSRQVCVVGDLGNFGLGEFGLGG